MAVLSRKSSKLKHAMQTISGSVVMVRCAIPLHTALIKEINTTNLSKLSSYGTICECISLAQAFFGSKKI